MHASLLADGRDLSIADLVRPAHVILHVHFLAQIHFCSASLQCTDVSHAASQIGKYRAQASKDCMQTTNK